MPKISYLDILDNGADYTEVTASHIEQKIADIEALLRGMIDEDNLLAKDDGSGIVPISPSNVVDMPIETRPVQHCMKFFGFTTDHPEGIVEELFGDLLSWSESRPDISILGGIGDDEIFLSLEKLSSQRKTVTVEIPSHYIPMTVKNLWEIVAPDGKFIASSLNYSLAKKFYTEPVEINTIEEFYKCLNNAGYPDDILFEGWYNVQANMQFWSVTDPIVDIENNSFYFTCEGRSGGNVDNYVCRYGLAVLCRVNP